MKIFLRVLAFVCTAAVGLAVAEHRPPYVPEQSNFSAEDASVQNPVAIPDAILAALGKDEMVRAALEYAKLPVNRLPESWFSASVVHLGNQGEQDFVVVAEGDLAGGNITTFWVFRSTDHGPEMVLMTRAHDLFVEKIRWKGYREIKASAATAERVSTVLYRFDGQQYAKYRSKSDDIK